MQHYPSLTPLRAASAGQFGVTTPTGPVECKKQSIVPASRHPLAGRITHVAPNAVPAAVAAVPTPTSAKNARRVKVKPQFQHLPRFQPPSFEGAHGALPCPDSPGSTPREGSSEQGQQEREMTPQATPVSTKVKRAPSNTASPGALTEAEKLGTGSYPIGSIVEYKSRSSGQWILAKVEGFDESNRTYRLDVQMHAQPERIRRSESAEQPLHVAMEQAGRPVSSLQNAIHTCVSSQQTSTMPLDGSQSAAVRERSGEPDINTNWLLLEAEALRKKVLWLQSENEVLQERVLQEASLKDQYFAELCACHEQLQRARGTPR